MIVTGSFFVYVQAYLTQMLSMQNLMKTHKDHHDHLHHLLLYAVVQLWYILLYSYYCYISLYICIISGIGSPIYGNPFYHLRKWLKLVLTVVYTVIQLLLLYILLYISYIYTLSYYRNFVYSPHSTQLHLLVTVCTINSITFSNSVYLLNEQQGI